MLAQVRFMACDLTPLVPLPTPEIPIPFPASTSQLLIRMLTSCLMRLSVEKRELFLRQALPSLTRLLTQPPAAPTDAPMNSGSGGDFSYQIEQNDPQVIEEREQQRFRQWEALLGTYLPPTFNLIESVIDDGIFCLFLSLTSLSYCPWRSASSANPRSIFAACGLLSYSISCTISQSIKQYSPAHENFTH